MTLKRYEIIATCFDRKGRVLGTGVNSYTKTHPLMQYFAEKAGESAEKIFQHAELVAILASQKKSIHSILVQRFKLNGEPALAKPCKTCQEMLKAFGVNQIRYTTEEGVEEYAIN